MKIIIPVAGIGTRLQPLTLTTPKPLLPVAGKPVLRHVIDQVTSLDPEEIIFIVGHLGRDIEAWVDQNVRVPSRCVEQSELLGLGYAVKLGLDVIPSGPVLILLGDTLVNTDLKEFVSAGDNVLGIKQVDDPGKFGVANVSDGKVTRLVEKPDNPDSDLAAVGLYYLSDPSSLKSHLEDILSEGSRTRGEIQLTDGLNRLMQAGTLFVPFKIDGWHDCGNFQTMLAANAQYLSYLSSMTTESIPEGCQLESPFCIDKSSVITDSELGPNVSIQAGCHVIGSTLSNCIVDEGTKIVNSTVKDSIIVRNSVINNCQIIDNVLRNN